MRKLVLFLIGGTLLLNLPGCTSNKATKETLQETLSSFSKAAYAGDWGKVKEYITEPVVIVENHTYKLSKDEFVERFKKRLHRSDKTNAVSVKVIYILPRKACLRISLQGTTAINKKIWRWDITKEYTFTKQRKRWLISKIVTLKRVITPPSVNNK